MHCGTGDGWKLPVEKRHVYMLAGSNSKRTPSGQPIVQLNASPSSEHLNMPLNCNFLELQASISVEERISIRSPRVSFEKALTVLALGAPELPRTLARVEGQAVASVLARRRACGCIAKKLSKLTTYEVHPTSLLRHSCDASNFINWSQICILLLTKVFI